jgi:hypothetical protein
MAIEGDDHVGGCALQQTDLPEAAGEGNLIEARHRQGEECRDPIL